MPRVRLNLDNHLIGTHVFRKGDVVDLPDLKAKAYLKAGHASLADGEDLTPIPSPRPRSELVLEVASDPKPAKSERAVTRK
jgi:hypothetical protein